jgi:hypothetical protein
MKIINCWGTKLKKTDIRRWKAIPCSWIDIINIVKMATLPKVIYRFNEIPIKISMTFFTEIKKNQSWSSYGSIKGPNRAILSKKSNAGGFTISDFKLHYRTIVIKITWYWQKTNQPNNNSINNKKSR